MQLKRETYALIAILFTFLLLFAAPSLWHHWISNLPDIAIVDDSGQKPAPAVIALTSDDVIEIRRLCDDTLKQEAKLALCKRLPAD